MNWIQFPAGEAVVIAIAWNAEISACIMAYIAISSLLFLKKQVKSTYVSINNFRGCSSNGRAARFAFEKHGHRYLASPNFDNFAARASALQ